MSDPIKLTKEGDRHTMTVASCTKLGFGDYPEYEFVGRDGSKVRVPESSTLRQLGRLDLTAESVAGRRVTIKRDKNAKQPNKPFWGIYLEDGEAEPSGGTGGAAVAARESAPTTGTHTTTAPTTQPDPEKGAALYAKITDYVLAHIVPRYQKAGIQVTHEGTAATVATLYIAANGRH